MIGDAKLKTEETLRDVYQILRFLVEKTRLAPSDGVQAALARLRAVVTTESAHAAESLATLHARRAYLKPRRTTLDNNAKYLASLVPKVQQNPKATPTQKAEARIRADQAAAELNGCIKHLADVEAAIAQREAAEAQRKINNNNAAKDAA